MLERCFGYSPQRYGIYTVIYSSNPCIYYTNTGGDIFSIAGITLVSVLGTRTQIGLEILTTENLRLDMFYRLMEHLLCGGVRSKYVTIYCRGGGGGVCSSF